ncbi:MAG: flagellar biosynthesis anti-sigma factor FlgM [Pseudomonadota bacterium]
MSIEISNNGINPRRQADAANASKDIANEAAKKDATNADRAARANAEQDAQQVRLSDEAQSLQRVQEALEREDSFDQQRVEEIKRAIGEGQYPIDNDRLARRFLDLEAQLTR